MPATHTPSPNVSFFCGNYFEKHFEWLFSEPVSRFSPAGDQASLLVTQPGSSPVYVGFTHKSPTVSTTAVLSTFADWFALAHLCAQAWLP